MTTAVQQAASPAVSFRSTAPVAASYLDLRHASSETCLSVRTLRSLIAAVSNPLPCIRLGAGKILIARRDLDAYLAEHRSVGSDTVERRIERRRARERKSRVVVVG